MAVRWPGWTDTTLRNATTLTRVRNGDHMSFELFKGGKLPPVHKPCHVALSDHLVAAHEWPPVPPRGWEFAVPADEMNILGNDVYGDCAPAGAYGLAQIQSCNSTPDDPIVPTTDEVLHLYQDVTGFDPDDPATDQGTVLTDLLDFWQKTGFEVTHRSGRKSLSQIVGWASLDISSFALMRWAAYTFGGSYLGIQCPQQCEQNTTNWNFKPGFKIAGGHCIVQAGEGSQGGKMRSWGLWIPASAEFMGAYIDEGHIVITKDWLNAQGKSPTGLDLNGLLAAMKSA
jgi:hypothetical protein